jgi:glycosyltransferase involved in cell wall biosynthesis
VNDVELELLREDDHRNPPPIRLAWLLIVPMPCFIDDDGRVWLERLWHRDLQRHLRYLRQLTLAAPCFAKRERSDLVRVEVPAGSQLHVVALSPMHTNMQALTGLPETIRQLWRAVAAADVVQGGVVGWPYSLGWLANPMALLRKKKLVIVIESAPWRTTGHGHVDCKRRLRAAATERMARFFVNRASLNLFSHESYRQSLLTPGRAPGVVVPATWIDDEDILTQAQAEQVWREKLKKTPPVRLLFAAQLTEDKGTAVLLRALEQLGSMPGLAVDVIGTGPERARFERLALQSRGVPLRVLEPVPYGAAFFELTQHYHALLVPSLSDEQPRIVFDAASQAVPLIASDTDGLRPHIAHERSGWLVPRGDASALASAMRRAAQEPRALERLGMNALSRVRGMTHDRMHKLRWRLLVENFGTG